MRLFVFAGLLAAGLCTALPVGAALIVYEGFDDDDAVLVGNGGGVGWSGNWTNAGTTVAHVLSNDDVSLTSPAPTSGDRVRSTGGAGAAGASAHRVTRALSGANTLNVNANTEVYASYLIKKTVTQSSSQNNLEVGLLAPGSSASGGIIRTGSGSDETLLLDVTGTGGTYAGAGNTFVQNVTYMMVMKIVTSSTAGGDSVSLSMFNTALPIPTTPPVVWDRSWTGDITASTGLGRVQLWTGYQAGGEFDEIRIGSTFADIVVPEPSTSFLLLGIAALAFGYRRCC